MPVTWCFWVPRWSIIQLSRLFCADRNSDVLKWLLALVIALLLLGVLSPWLRKIGIGRLPGDVDIQRNGKRYSFPIGSTVMLSLLASLVYWMLR